MRALLLVLALLLLGCDPAVTPVPYDWSALEDEAFRYRYAGSAVEVGDKRHLFYCANIDRADRFLVTDHIVMRTALRRPATGEWDYGEERVALFPGEPNEAGEVPWDFEHICDPEVVAGTFWHRRPGSPRKEKFRYALFYLGIQGLPDYLDGIPDGNVNQIGWAVAHDLEGPWHKVGSGPLITSEAAGFWGVGQPSAISLDGRGEVLLFYTRGESEGTGTFRQGLSLLDADRPVLHGERVVPTEGFLQPDGSPDPLTHGAAFAFDEQTDRFFIIRDGHPHPSDCPDFISDRLQVAYLSAEELWAGEGSWTLVAQIGPGFPPRIFDGGWVRNGLGGLADPDTLETLISVSLGEGSFCPLAGLWSYRIHGALIPKPTAPGRGKVKKAKRAKKAEAGKVRGKKAKARKVPGKKAKVRKARAKR